MEPPASEDEKGAPVPLPPPPLRLPEGASPPRLPLPEGASPPRLRLSDGASPPPLSSLEIRLFYVRVAPCAPDAVPPYLTLSHLRREIGVFLEINGARVPASDPTSIPLRRAHLDTGGAEVTYVSTDAVRLTGAAEFEVSDDRGNLILCGSLEAPWLNGAIHHQGDSKTGWSMDCYSAASIGSSAFFQPKLGISSPSIEVYVAGCFAGFPLILTQTVQLSPRRKVPRPGNLDAIPEDEETSSMEKRIAEGLHHRRLSSSSVVEGAINEHDMNMKVGHGYYPEGWYSDDDGQLTWFNAGVRVGVGIGLGMCVGIGIGVGLLMQSYQATTRNFRRRFF